MNVLLPNLQFHESEWVLQQRCSYINYIKPEEKCAFVNKSLCDTESELILYHRFMFCEIRNPSYENPIFILTTFMMFLFFAFLFYLLAITVDECICPVLGVISSYLHLSENLAGVTILALGNGAPEIISSIVSTKDGSTILMYNNLLGGAMFITSFVAGMIAFARPFHLQTFIFVRDILFIIGSISWIQHSTKDEKVSDYAAASYIVIYLIYALIAIVGHFSTKRLQRYHIRIDESDVDWTDLRKSRKSTDIDFSDSMINVSTFSEEDLTLCKDLWYCYRPFSKMEWKVLRLKNKIGTIMKLPWLLLIRIFIPIVNFGSPRNGWCKLLSIINITLFPSFVAVGLHYHREAIGGLSVMAYLGTLGFILGIIVFFTSEIDHPPRYHVVFAFMTFSGSILIILNLVKEIVALITLFGTLCGIRYQTLGLTALAWGGGLPDAITNISLAKRGFQRMAFTGCFAGPLATTLLSLGITILSMGGDQYYHHIRSGIMGPNCSVFLLISLSFSLLYMLLTNFDARKSYGLFLILVYVEFLVFAILCEFHLIHPFGTDHEFDTELYNTSKSKMQGMLGL